MAGKVSHTMCMVEYWLCSDARTLSENLTKSFKLHGAGVLLIVLSCRGKQLNTEYFSL